MSDPGAAGRYDGAMSDSRTVGKGFKSGGGEEAAGGGIQEASDGASQAVSGVDGGSGAMKGIASVPGMVAMSQVRQVVTFLFAGEVV